MLKIKKILPWFIFTVFVIIITLGILLKGKMEHKISEMMKTLATESDLVAGERFIDSAYNYVKNGKDFKLTFLAFSAEDCSACRRMESVMKEVENEYDDVNVVFVNVLLPESQIFVKYYGIAAVPTQILLDENGREYFKHHGYYSFKKISTEIEIILKKST